MTDRYSPPPLEEGVEEDSEHSVESEKLLTEIENEQVFVKDTK